MVVCPVLFYIRDRQPGQKWTGGLTPRRRQPGSQKRDGQTTRGGGGSTFCRMGTPVRHYNDPTFHAYNLPLKRLKIGQGISKNFKKFFPKRGLKNL